MNPKNSVNAILESLAAQQRQGETSLIVRIQPDLIQDAMKALRDYRTLFAPFVPGLTDPVPTQQIYERMRDASETRQTVLLLVECRSIGEFREALERMPLRKSVEWRDSFNETEWRSFFSGRID